MLFAGHVMIYTIFICDFTLFTGIQQFNSKAKRNKTNKTLYRTITSCDFCNLSERQTLCIPSNTRYVHSGKRDEIELYFSRKTKSCEGDRLQNMNYTATDSIEN